MRRRTMIETGLVQAGSPRGASSPRIHGSASPSATGRTAAQAIASRRPPRHMTTHPAARSTAASGRSEGTRAAATISAGPAAASGMFSPGLWACVIAPGHPHEGRAEGPDWEVTPPGLAVSATSAAFRRQQNARRNFRPDPVSVDASTAVPSSVQPPLRARQILRDARTGPQRRYPRVCDRLAWDPDLVHSPSTKRRPTRGPGRGITRNLAARAARTRRRAGPAARRHRCGMAGPRRSATSPRPRDPRPLDRS